MNKIEFIKEKIPFTQVANGVLTDSRLSAKAKGLYAYLYSKPDGWDFAVARICLEMADGERSVREGLIELEKFGFLTRNKQPDGRMVYMVHFPPIYPNCQNSILGTEPECRNSSLLKCQTAKIDSISNKDSLVIKNSNKEGVPEEGFDSLWVLYPEKIAKVKALESWKKLTIQEKVLAVMAIQKQVESNHFRGRDGQDYIPHPATWLNQKRWEDEIKNNNTPKGVMKF